MPGGMEMSTGRGESKRARLANILQVPVVREKYRTGETNHRLAASREARPS